MSIRTGHKARKRLTLDETAEKLADLLEKHFASLPAGERIVRRKALSAAVAKLDSAESAKAPSPSRSTASRQALRRRG